MVSRIHGKIKEYLSENHIGLMHIKGSSISFIFKTQKGSAFKLNSTSSFEENSHVQSPWEITALSKVHGLLMRTVLRQEV